MKRHDDFNEIYLCRKPLDFRRGKEAMLAIIEGSLGKKAIDGAIFGFINRRSDRIRCLYWDRSGFAQWSKVLEKQRFSWPRRGTDNSVTLSSTELAWLLDGVDIDKIKTHDYLHYSLIS